MSTDNYDPDFDYTGTVTKLGFAMRVIADIPLEKIVSTTEMAHTLGAMIDPTKYRDALQRGDMDAMCNLAKALIPAVKVWNEEIAPKIGA